MRGWTTDERDDADNVFLPRSSTHMGSDECTVRMPRLREGAKVKECKNCHGEGGYWTRNEDLREWEYNVCEVCKGTGEDAVSEAQRNQG